MCNGLIITEQPIKFHNFDGAGGSAGGGRGDAQAQSQGRVQARSASKIVTVPITTAPKKKNFATLEDLASSAANTSFPLEQRLASLQQLGKILSTAAGQIKASRFFDGVAPPLLQVLWDSELVLSTTAVSTVTAWLTPPPDGSPSNSGGGAIVARGPSSSSSSSSAAATSGTTEHPGSLILGLLLPILSSGKYPDRLPATPTASSIPETSSWTSLTPHQLASVLIISRECLAKISGLAAFKLASALFSVARSLVENCPSPSLVADTGAVKRTEVNSNEATDSSPMVFIGPAFELLVQAMKVHHVPSHIALSIGDAILEWARRSDLPGSVRPVLARGMYAVGVAWSSARIGDSSGQQFEHNNVLQLLEEILSTSSSSAQVLLNLTACAVPFIVRALSLREITGKQGEKDGSGWNKMEPMVVRLVNKFAELVEESGKMEDRQDLLLTAEEVRELCRYLHTIISAALKPPTSSIAGVGEQQQQQTVASRPNILARPVEENEMQEETASVSSEPCTKENDPYSLLAAAIRLYTSALQRPDFLHHPERSSSLAKDLLSWINQLPHNMSSFKNMEDSLVQLSLPPEGPLSLLRSSATPAVVQPVALLYVQLLTRLPALLHAVLDELKATFYCYSSSSDMAVASKLAFDVNVLLAAIKAGVSKESQEIWATMAELLLHYSSLQKKQQAATPALNALVPKLVQIAQLALASSPEETTEEGKEREESLEKWCRAVELAGQLLESTPKIATQMLHWQLQCIPKVSALHKNGAEAVKYTSSERAYAGKTILDAEQVVELCEAALVAAAEDTEEKVAQQAKQVVLACSVPIAFSLLGGHGTSLASNLSLLQPTQEIWDVVNEPRQRGFSPSQLSQVLDFIAGSAAPASNVLVGGGQAAQKGTESPPYEWLVHLVQEMEALKYGEDGEKVIESIQLDDKSSNSSSPAAATAASLWWLVLQTAAKQCVESKLTTHWGGAAQSLGMLERAVQKLSSTSSSSQGKSGAQRGVDFDLASKNKQELGAAISGSVVRCPPNKAAALYFSGNRKVCEEWLARLRPAASIAAIDLKLYHLAVYHGLRHLERLKKQGDELNAKISEEKKENDQEEGKKILEGVVEVARKEEKKLGLLQRPKQSSISTIISRSSPLKTSLEENTKRKSITTDVESTVQGKIAALRKSADEAASLLSSALSALRESDAIAGVHSLCTQIVASLSSPTTTSSSSAAFDWLQAAELSARGNCEAAIELLMTNTTKHGQDHYSTAAMVVGAEAYAALHDWDGLQLWLKTAQPGSLDTRPGLQGYFEMATWGMELSSTPSSSSSFSSELTPEETVGNAIGVENILLQGHSSNLKTAALEALVTFSKSGGNQSALNFTSNQILIDCILGQSSVGEFGMLPKCAIPEIAEAIGALAALQLAMDPQRGGRRLLDPCLALSRVSANGFSAWKGGNDFVCNPAAVNVAHTLLDGMTSVAATGESSNSVAAKNKSLALLRLSAAAVSQATGNLTTAKKMYDDVKKMLGGTALDVEIEASLRLHQQRAFSPAGGRSAVSPVELVQFYERACDSTFNPSGGEVNETDASICWQYAQYMKQQDILESGKEEEKAAACLASITAAAKALSLAGSLAQSDNLGVLPIVLFIYRMLIESADVISIHEQTIRSSIEQVPVHSWRLIIPQLISLLSTSRVPAIQRIASQLLIKAAESSCVGSGASKSEDTTCVLLPAMVELQRQVELQNHPNTAVPCATSSPSSSPPSSSLQTLVNTLRTSNPALCEDLSEFIQSLASLALLKDEKWHAVLVEAQGTLTKRLAASYAYLKTLRPKDSSCSSTDGDVFTASFVEAATEEVACAVAPVLAALRCHVATEAADIPDTAEGSLITPHEKQFREKMNLVPRLHWMLEQLELPLQLVAGEKAAAGTLESAFQRPLQAIKKVAGEVAAVGMTVTEVDLANACPALSALVSGGGNSSSSSRAKPSSLRVPRGLGNVTTSTFASFSPSIESIESEVKVLHTKTRPKKITLRGSDGHTYSFLVKGREDLRVDLAVTTFFAAADIALSASTKRGFSTSSPALMPLTVVPVGPQAGLVGWVERTKPLYGVYASYEAERAQRAAWLAAATLAQTPLSSVAAASCTSASSKQDQKSQRGGKKSSKDGAELTKTQIKKNKKAEKEAAAAASAAAAAAAQAAAQAALDNAKQPLRPADIFRSKIKAAGVNTASPRSTWPLEALKSVFIDLSATAPHNMIANELLFSAAGAAHWWSRQHHYTTSTAVMSIFGYLLGLGDRHLDNVLLQSDTGMVLHVDFGVLFNRGTKLHVPEVVPFRLTQSFVAGLGVAGVEGKFKREAEAGLVAVRKNVESLSMLLQSFVEDPLISWAPEIGTKTSRLVFERCVELTHFRRSMEELFEEKEKNTAAAIDVASAVKDASSVLERLSTDIGPFCSIFFKAQKALATVSEHHQQIERCSRTIEDGEVEDVALQNTLSVTATEIENLQLQLDSAVRTASVLEASNSSFGSTASGNLPDSFPYAGVLSAILDGHLGAALQAAVPTWDPSLAAVPLGMVQSYSSPELTLVNVALGLQPSAVPVTASLLLKAATVDDAGREALRKGTDAIRGALAAVQQYANAVNALNNTNISTSDEPGASSSLYYTLLTQGCTSSVAARDTARVLSTWRTLKVHCRASTSLLANLTNTQSTLKLERIDVALAAADAKEKLAAVLAVSSPAMLAINLEEFTAQVADQFRVLAVAIEPTADLIDAMQHIALGYATVVLAAEESAVVDGDGGGDGGGSANWLMEAVPWLRSAVQAADSIGSVAGEMQLIVPQLTSLLACKGDIDIASLSNAFTAIKEKLENYADLAFTSGSSDSCATEEEEVSVAVMAQLLDMSTTWPTIGSFLQCLHAVQAATTTGGASLDAGDENIVTALAIDTGPVLRKLLSNKQSTTSHWECLELAAAAVDAWNGLLTAATCHGGSDVGSTKFLSSNVDAEVDVLQKSISSTVSAAVSIAVQLHFLPAVHAVMKKTSAELKEKAKNLPRKKLIASSAVKKGTYDMEESFTSITTTENYAGASMLFEKRREDGFAAQGPAVPLPAFFDYLDDDNDEEDTIGGLGGLESLVLEDKGVSELGEQMYQLEDSCRGDGDLGEEEGENLAIDTSSTISEVPSSSTQLSNLISLCSDKSGALAAVDAVLHVTATTMYQVAQQAQQAQVDLAAHQWMHEPVLINSSANLNIAPEDLKKALQQEGTTVGGAPLKLALLPSPIELTLSALCTPRYEVLSNLKSAVAALHSAEEEIHKWKGVAIPIENLFSSELLRIAPSAAANIEVCLEAGHGWRNTAVMHEMHLKDAVKSLLECEAARDMHAAAQKVDNQEGNDAAGGADADQELKMKFEKEREEYGKAIEHVHAMRDALSTAQSSFTAHQEELDTLRREVRLAAEEISKIEKRADAAVEQVSNVALPLVKATQKLPTTLQTVQEYILNADVAVEVLSTLQRRLARVHAATASSLISTSSKIGGGHADGSTSTTSLEVQISKVLENLSTSVDSLRTLPSALHILQYSVDAARRSLLQHGGRGVAAAREQAGGVVRQCKEAMEKLQPLLETAESNAAKLSLVSPLLCDLVSLATAEIDALCDTHHFELNPSSGGGVAFASLSSCASSVHLYPPPYPLGKVNNNAETGFAMSAMQQFDNKVYGTGDVVVRRRREERTDEKKEKEDSQARRTGDDGYQSSVSEYVEALIEEATNVDNLSKMYEGWMPWV
ncbi:hypothetical protein Ndes2526B_g07322 [Nannochloris sp. 'desiccata']